MTPVVLLVLGLAQQPPAPRPFPQPSEPVSRPAPPPQTRPGQQQPPPAAPPATTAPAGAADAQPAPLPANPAAPTEELLGIKVYPGARFLGSFDAGRGQRFYLYGAAASFADLVTFYRNLLRQRGELVFDAPATHEFDVGRFREETMAFPPGVTIKEYKSEISDGYPNPDSDGQPARFPTVIQIVPVPVGDR